MKNVKERIEDELKKATTWLSTNDVVTLVNESYHRTRRALRSLYDEGKLKKSPIQGDRYGRKQWVDNDVFESYRYKGLPKASSPTGTVWVNPKTKKPARQKSKKSNIQVVATTNHGDLIMQIEQGVETIVGEFVAAEKKFSAHDVTKELRDRVNAGSLQVDPGLAGTAHVAGKDVTKIEHPFVKDAVHALMTSGKFDYDRAHNGTYFEYFPLDANTVASPPVAPVVNGASYNGGSVL